MTERPSVTPSVPRLRAARRLYQEREARDLFYRAAADLVDLAMRGATKLNLGEALAVLLQSWNASYYRFRRDAAARHLDEIQALLDRHRDSLSLFRNRRLTHLRDADALRVQGLFTDFENVLGPVGAAKVLHLLAPLTFPIWDRAIAKAYSLALGPAGRNGGKYWQMMQMCRKQLSQLARRGFEDPNPLKALDEYNYCHFTKGWL